MDESVINVVQVSDESGVGQALASALGGRAKVTYVPARQVGAHWNPAWKPLAFIPRCLGARKTRSNIDSLQPRPDLLHIHWLPNGLIGAVGSRRFDRIPWVLHIHGSDIREVKGWRLAGYRRLLRSADAVVFSTPDLTRDVRRWRPDAEHLPVPIALEPIVAGTTWDAFAPSAALPVKGASAIFATLRLIAAARPHARLAAMTGPAFEPGPWDQLPLVSHASFLRRLARANVVIGQLKLGILSVVELEAMAMGRPVVGWTHPHLYPDAPPLASASKPAEAARAVLDLLDDTGRRLELGYAGMDWVRKHHEPETIARQLLAIYHRVLAAAREP